ncbi:biotin--[acetyl-CoA-carboxylase] ligase [Siculibacillus lacustris]|uniref:biotin--[biotin carboxyl-carrier protein] ligase n=1 Tax=Siculibacillus lacustris TaxID=1549641 RepID=A0A4Q9VMU4_9HYPH|nr:biotin--[acetyl-CoA-carboxylase] ligase [Siculibacillus lacustris]TBW36950.1 biotin--[acetyl-CoA-carboxylase] ligase [Siculibacillus lacustris]
MGERKSAGDRWTIAGGRGSWPVLRFPEIGSTNDEALARARAGLSGERWFVADRQTSGRGRRGRVWTSEIGNLYASALLIDPCAPEHLPEIPFVAAVAVHAAVAGRSAATLPALKWPNDLMFAGRKVAGLLLESSRLDDGRMAVAIGFGVNCISFPAGTETPATCLLTEGLTIYPEVLLADLDATLRATLADWDRGRDFAAIRRRWLAAATGLGGPIRVRLADGERNGLFEAIDETGRLVLVEEDGRRRLVSAGDVFFPPVGGNEVK